MNTDYPEHEKLDGIKDKSQLLGDLLEHLRQKGVGLYYYVEDSQTNRRGEKIPVDIITPYRHSIPEILADFFGIDLAKLDAEKNKMLEEFRKQNK